MISRTVIIGLGRRGHEVLDRMSSAQRAATVVIDTDLAVAALGTYHGARPVIGNGADVAALRDADVPRATRVIVTVADDVVALRILSAVRWINEQAVLVVALHETQWEEVARYLGADHVVAHKAPSELVTCDDGGLRLVDRAVRWSEIGQYLVECAPAVLAAVRGDAHRWRDQEEPHVLRAGDRVLEVACAQENT
ncbi:NAD-binding protein [Lentzea sp. NPDC034063]|uniref:NAD-binding protein n=1 Tax=unclassified Lentzea TaxID=2643253 RepID=UPI0033F2DD9B